jgi:sugar transferase EpsL
MTDWHAPARAGRKFTSGKPGHQMSAMSAFKRAIDLAASGIALAILLPLLFGLWLAITWRMGSPAIFRQPRGGLGNQPFVFYKFRTMTNARDADGELLPDHARLTAFGRWLRDSSLDELPQLWNVLKGDMSLIGPRPLLAEYLPLYDNRQRERHRVRPGITGWAQVNGRNALSWPEKFELDVWYVEHWSLQLDARILWRTLQVALGRKDIDQGRSVTMPRFTGHHEPFPGGDEPRIWASPRTEAFVEIQRGN